MAKKPKDPAVRVRMYRQGLGDCFLVTIDEPRQPFHIMIDCGVWGTSKESSKLVGECVEDIAARTGGQVDLMVVTHEHWDHVSGFSEAQARAVFAEGRLKIKELLVAWTEDPADPVATVIREKFAALRQAFAGAIKSTHDAGLKFDHRTEAVLGAAGLSLGTNPSEAFGWLKQHANDSPTTQVSYARPGNTKKIPGGVVYVLGPPRDLGKLRKTEGGKKAHKEGETYARPAELDVLGDILGSGMPEGLAAAAHRVSGSRRRPQDPARPFNERLGTPLAKRSSDEFIRAVYDGGRNAKNVSWRRIDQEWSSSMAELALRMDKFTNNTSLALAIELEHSKRVLLFPADAQFGNWMSWDDVQFENAPEVKTEDLLRRTTLYKVGHHGSHNATLRTKGLNRMNSEHLVAMIPVDEKFARKQPGGGWNMPFPGLLEDLKTRTKGRVLRADTGAAPAKAVDVKVRRAYQRAVRETRLYVEYTF
jgi:hypothetical protein